MPVLPTKFIDSETITIESKTETIYSSYSLNRQVSKQGAPHQWLIEFRTPPFEPETARELNAFLNALGGRYGTFTLPDPLGLMGEGLSDLTASGGVKGDSTVNLTTARANGETPIKVGDYFKWSNHDKVYQCTETLVLDGIDSISFYPALQADVNLATVEPAVFSLALTSDINAYSADAKKYVVSQTIRAEENV